LKNNYNIEFWNFVCHFGESKLLDYYLDLVHPAFIGEFKRNYGDSQLFFYDVQLIEIEINDETLPFIHGRLIKDTKLEREQVYENETLKEDKLTLPSAPSSIFILSLIDHRLFFIKEHRDSPSMEAFKATITKFIKDHRAALIDGEYQEKKEQREFYGKTKKHVTKKDLAITYPEPNIEVIPLSSDADIEEFIRSMKIIDSVRLDLVMPNDEADCNPFFNEWRKKKKLLGESKSNISFTKTGKQSLPHQNVSDLSKEAAKDENVLVTLRGKDILNDKLIGTHDQFKLTKTVNELEDTPHQMTYMVYKTFKKLITDGVVRGPKISNKDKVKEKIKHILAMLK
jgi:hypothetical protein